MEMTAIRGSLLVIFHPFPRCGRPPRHRGTSNRREKVRNRMDFSTEPDQNQGVSGFWFKFLSGLFRPAENPLSRGGKGDFE